VRAFLVGVCLFAFACTRSAADHEELGDRWYATGQYRDALAEYVLGVKAQPGSADLHAKAAAAAIHVQDYPLAVSEYRALARADRSRTDEAADGLERAVRAALAANERVSVALGLAALRVVAPSRPLGRYARLAALDAADQGDTNSALALLPTAIAVAPDLRTADSLLYVYGMTAVRAHDCDTALPLFTSVLRRHNEPAVADGAREGLGLCALLAGQQALAKGQPAAAEDWFRRATAPGSPADVQRAAYLGLGDVQLALGDVAGALESYQQVLAGGAPADSLTLRAQQKINALGRPDAPPQPQTP